MIIWLTGLSGSGKTTISNTLLRLFKPSVGEMVQVDGDEVRAVFGGDLSYRQGDRYKQIQRIQRLALMLDRQDLVVVVSALYSHPALLAWNRENFNAYLEVYLNAPLALVRARDPKGLYAEATLKELPQVVGLDIPWLAPTDPDLQIDMAAGETPEQIAQQIATRVPRLADAVAPVAVAAGQGR